MFQLIHFVAVALIWLVYKFHQWRSNVLLKIPGPTPLPFIGNIHQLETKQPHIQLTRWKEVYGDIFRVNIFGEYSVVVNKVDGLRDVLVDKGVEFGGRPQTFRSEMCFAGKDIAFQPYSPHLQHVRKIAHWALRSFSVGMDRLEATITEETAEMLQIMSDFKGEAFDPNPIFHTGLCNMMTSIILGKRFKSTDVEVKQVLLIDELFNTGLHPINGAELDKFPWLRYLGNRSYKILKQATRVRDEFIEKHFRICKEALNPSDIRGILEALFVNQKPSNNNEPYGPAGNIDDQDIKGIVNDLIVAGTITTTTALTISLLVLINRPDIKRKLHDQVDQAVSHERFPTLKDRPSLPYVDAFNYEILRYSSHVPMALPHVAMVDTTIGGHEIPKGTQVLINVWNVHHDEENFVDPWSFKPERFLDDQGQLVSPDHPARRKLMAFGAGRRVCIGENFAKSRLFLVMSAFLQKFDVVPENSSDVPSHDPKGYSLGLVLKPQPFKVRVTERCAPIQKKS